MYRHRNACIIIPFTKRNKSRTTHAVPPDLLLTIVINEQECHTPILFVSIYLFTHSRSLCICALYSSQKYAKAPLRRHQSNCDENSKHS